MNSVPATARLSWLEKISYGVGDMGFNFYWANIATFLMFFYTDVFGISAASAGSMLALIKIVNAFTDPMIGATADRTRTRFGKFRPYLVWMALPLASAGVLTYTTPNLGQDGKLVWAYATYLFMMVSYTGINIPYNALSGVISNDAQERSTVNGLRFLFAFTGSLLVTGATPHLVKWLGHGNEKLGWQMTMVFWGVAASCIFAITFFNTRERITPAPTQKSAVWEDLRDLSRNAPWLVLFALSLIIMLTITLRTATAAYYFKYYVTRPELTLLSIGGHRLTLGSASFVPTYMAAAAIGASIAPLLTRLLDKRKLLMILMTATGCLSIAFFFVPSDGIVWMFALQLAIGLVLGPKSPLAWSMYADTADYNEWRTGRRATAMTFAAATFSQKLGTALAAGMMGWVFTALGYVANKAQSSRSQTGIVLLMSIIPAVFAFLAVAVMLFYRLDNQQMTRIQTDLSERKEKLSHAPSGLAPSRL